MLIDKIYIRHFIIRDISLLHSD